MAVDKLALYNNAALLIGQRSFTGLTEDREPRYLLDSVYDLGAIEYCLEIVKPTFARKTTALASPAVSTAHDLDSVHTLPDDYIALVGVYSDSKLDQPISRYIIEDGKLACEYAIIYLRYISDSHVTTFTNWTPSFSSVVAAYLAREICLKLSPDQYEAISALFADRIEVARGLDAEQEPAERSSATTNTLTNDWRNVYNDALLIMGLEEITANNDDSNRRTKLDRALDSGLVASLLEDVCWTFAITSTKSEYDPSVEPAWGYSRAHKKPADIHRIYGLFHDEMMQSPLKLYQDEGGYFFTQEDEFYLQYISTDWLINPAQWPSFFRRLVGSKMAYDAAPSLKREGADINWAREVYQERESTAKSIDAMESPPRLIASGSWAGSRYRGNSRDRP